MNNLTDNTFRARILRKKLLANKIEQSFETAINYGRYQGYSNTYSDLHDSLVTYSKQTVLALLPYC